MDAANRESRLSPEQLAELRGVLEAELRKLERSMKTSEEGLRPITLDHTAVGRLSRMDELQNQALTRNLHEREKMRLSDLLGALQRLESGAYGLCSECGGPIFFERLAVFPEASTCRECGGPPH